MVPHLVKSVSSRARRENLSLALQLTGKPASPRFSRNFPTELLSAERSLEIPNRLALLEMALKPLVVSIFLIEKPLFLEG